MSAFGFDLSFGAAAAWGLALAALVAAGVWVASLFKRDVSILDSFWGPLIWLPAATVAAASATGPRAMPVLLASGLWALRLSLYITWRHHGHPEDHRYQAIRARNQPNYEWKSLYLVFGLQAVLAWVVSAPLMAAVASPAGWRALDAVGFAIMAFGLAFESTADWQLARFKADPSQRGRVLTTGLWCYTRHPNYFGECCLWWGAWLVATAAGAWWTVVSPVLMTILLLRVSGVALLERDIGERRPGYEDYIRRTNAFIPGWPRT